MQRGNAAAAMVGVSLSESGNHICNIPQTSCFPASPKELDGPCLQGQKPHGKLLAAVGSGSSPQHSKFKYVST